MTEFRDAIVATMCRVDDENMDWYSESALMRLEADAILAMPEMQAIRKALIDNVFDPDDVLPGSVVAWMREAK